MSRHTPKKLLSITIATIFVAEAVIMVLLSMLPELSLFATVILDATLIIIFVFPTLYFSMFKPMLRDFHERKRAEEQRRVLQEQLERAERLESLGILAGGVAHDLNNMLGPIVGYSELILEQLNAGDQTRQQIERISKSARDAVDVIQDLLTLARQGRYDMAPVDFNQVVRDYMESPGFLALTDGRPDIETWVDLDDSNGLVMGSPAHLSKVVMNLMTNAFDAMPKGGSVSIATSQRTERDPVNGAAKYIVFSLADTGEGIDPDDLEKIFEPYYTKRKMGLPSGTGPGLSVVHGVVKDHKGHYKVSARSGKGTEFQIFFPVTSVKPEPIQKSPRELAVGTETVLIVDDNEMQRTTAAALLERLGYDVRIAASGEAAVDYLKINSVDLVLLDMIMDPGMDGLDTYRQIIEIHPGQKVVIASGYSSTDRVEEMQRLGAGQYIRKPFTLRTVGDAVREELKVEKSPAVS